MQVNRTNTAQPLADMLPKLPSLAQLGTLSPKVSKLASPLPAVSTTSEPAVAATEPYYSVAPDVADPLAMVAVTDIVLNPVFAEKVGAEAAAKALARARTEFCGQENERRYARLIRLKSQPPPPRTASQVRDYVLTNAHLLDQKIAGRLARGEPGYEIDPAVEPLFRLRCLYFARDARFETDDPTSKRKLHKGLLILGNVGAGKTTLLRIFRQANPAAGMSFHEASYQDLDQAFGNQEKGKGGLGALTKYTQQPYFVDDVGREPGESSHWGEHKNVVEVVLESRNQKCLPSYQFHATTNLSELLIYRKYGKRIYSRFLENFNFLAFPADAKDRRTGQNPDEFDAHIAALEAAENPARTYSMSP